MAFDRNNENIELANIKIKQINKAYNFLLKNKAKKILNKVFYKYKQEKFNNQQISKIKKYLIYNYY